MIFSDTFYEFFNISKAFIWLLWTNPTIYNICPTLMHKINQFNKGSTLWWSPINPNSWKEPIYVLNWPNPKGITLWYTANAKPPNLSSNPYFLGLPKSPNSTPFWTKLGMDSPSNEHYTMFPNIKHTLCLDRLIIAIPDPLFHYFSFTILHYDHPAHPRICMWDVNKLWYRLDHVIPWRLWIYIHGMTNIPIKALMW